MWPAWSCTFGAWLALAWLAGEADLDWTRETGPRVSSLEVAAAKADGHGWQNLVRVDAQLLVALRKDPAVAIVRQAVKGQGLYAWRRLNRKNNEVANLHVLKTGLQPAQPPTKASDPPWSCGSGSIRPTATGRTKRSTIRPVAWRSTQCVRRLSKSTSISGSAPTPPKLSHPVCRQGVLERGERVVVRNVLRSHVTAELLQVSHARGARPHLGTRWGARGSEVTSLCVSFIDLKRARFMGKVRGAIALDLPPELHLQGRPEVGLLRRATYGTQHSASCWEAVIQDLPVGEFAAGRVAPCNFFHVERGLRITVHGDNSTTLGCMGELQCFTDRLKKPWRL